MSGEYDSISGGYLRKGKDGMIPTCLIGNEVKILEEFPLVLETIKNRKILQLYSSGNDVVAMIGSRHYDGPYNESEYLEVKNFAKDDNLICVLSELNSQLSKNEEKEDAKTYRKAYKLYGSDKYKLEEENK